MVAGLSLCNQHTIVFYLAPIILVIFSFLWKSKELSVKRIGILAGMFFLGLSPYIYLVISSHYPRKGNWGDMTSWKGNLLFFLPNNQAYCITFFERITVLSAYFREIRMPMREKCSSGVFSVLSKAQQRYFLQFPLISRIPSELDFSWRFLEWPKPCTPRKHPVSERMKRL